MAHSPLELLALTNLALEGAAAGAVEHPAPHTAMLVVLRPGTTDAVVVAHEADAKLRAAVRVAIAAGNQRGWAGATDRIERRRIGELPELIADVARAERVRGYHLAGVFHGEAPLAVALWFSRKESDSAAAVAYRRDSLRLLQAAADSHS